MQYGDWAVLEPMSRKPLCRCACGTERRVWGYDLKSGKSKGCGCRSARLTGERSKVQNRKHGFADTPTMTSWTEMKRRCYATHRKEYPNYGGRGIVVCDRWLESFDNFLADMGPRPEGHTIEREDNDGPYSPSNCRWTPRAVQERNKRSNRMITVFGETMTLADAADRWNINYHTLHGRIHVRSWDPERAVTTPAR